MKEFYNSRIGRHLTYTLVYFLMWKLIGFEFTMITLGLVILVDLDFKQDKL
jgi:hypothetical protein